MSRELGYRQTNEDQPAEQICQYDQGLTRLSSEKARRMCSLGWYRSRTVGDTLDVAAEVFPGVVPAPRFARIDASTGS